MNILVLLAFVPALYITVLLIRAFALLGIFGSIAGLFGLTIGIADIGGPQSLWQNGVLSALGGIGMVLGFVAVALLKLLVCLLPIALGAYLYSQGKYAAALGVLSILVLTGIIFFPQINGLSKNFGDTPKGSDAATLIQFPHTSYSKDSVHAFWQDVIISEADSATFEVIDSSRYAKDKNHVYFSGKVLTNDPSTFETVGIYGYAKDTGHVWYFGMLVPGADPATFIVTDDGRGKDKNHTYDTINIVN